MLEKHRDVFSNTPGFCQLEEHRIEIIPGAVIPRRKVYPVPQAYRDEIRRQIHEMLRNGIIKECQTPVSHSVVAIKKKDGSLLRAIDYRAINSCTVPDIFPFKNATELIQDIGRAKFISTTDASQGYWQIPMHPDSIQYTGFQFENSSYAFLRLPFGLMNAASTYQRMANRLLQPHDGYAHSFIDDIGVYSGRFQRHLNDLDSVLFTVKENGLTLKFAKSCWGQKYVKFLGHICGQGTHSPDPAKVEAISQLRFPRNKKQMKSVLGLTGFYKQYIENYSNLTVPLTDALRKNQPVEIKPTADRICAFETLKEKLCAAPVLYSPDHNLPFILEADASRVAVGAVLSQQFEMAYILCLTSQRN